MENVTKKLFNKLLFYAVFFIHYVYLTMPVWLSVQLAQNPYEISLKKAILNHPYPVTQPPVSSCLARHSIYSQALFIHKIVKLISFHIPWFKFFSIYLFIFFKDNTESEKKNHFEIFLCSEREYLYVTETKTFISLRVNMSVIEVEPAKKQQTQTGIYAEI